MKLSGKKSLRATIKSIAKDLGISHMTVSRALSGSQNINEKTRITVVEHAHRVGYVKSSAASAMRGEQTAIVGLLLPNIINEFYARFANSLGTLCAEAGFDLVIHLTDDGYEQEVKSLVRLRALQARAVIRVPAPWHAGGDSSSPEGLQLIDFVRTRDDHSSVGALLIDDGWAIASAVDHLVSRGCKRIGYIGADRALSSGRNRLAAFADALAKNGQSDDESLVCTGPASYDMGSRSMSQMLDDDQPPDAVICGGFEISNGALDTCLAKNIDMPRQLRFFGYGDPSFYRWIAGGVSTISVSEHDLAVRALEMIQSPEILSNTAKQVMPTKLELRHSA